ncbi:GIY-YIG nuclease family protein [Patescibacteria group bacterium]|nr:GIY-YIG nuclease family protein [Patescibacteria group bacterium]
MKQYYVYILASNRNGTLYIGVTSHLIKRVYDHKSDLTDGFTKTHRVHRLVHYEITNDINSAIAREKQLKSWNRKWKVDLIEKTNPQWEDLYQDIVGQTNSLDPRVKPEDDRKSSPRMTKW